MDALSLARNIYKACQGKIPGEDPQAAAMTAFEAEMLEKKIDRAYQRGDLDKVDSLEAELDDLRILMANTWKRKVSSIQHGRKLVKSTADEEENKSEEETKE